MPSSITPLDATLMIGHGGKKQESEFAYSISIQFAPKQNDFLQDQGLRLHFAWGLTNLLTSCELCHLTANSVLYDLIAAMQETNEGCTATSVVPSGNCSMDAAITGGPRYFQAMADNVHYRT
jgi:hypothetical protein